MTVIRIAPVVALLTVPIIIATVLTNSVHAWGPLLHQSLSSSVLGCLKNATTVKMCFDKDNSAEHYSFILGSTAPDAGKKLSSRLHHFEFAAAAYEFAQSGRFKSRDGSFDARAFAIGYGYHLAQDFVGHYAQGYLTPEYNRPLQFAVDSGEFHTHFRKAFLIGFPFQKFNSEALRFLYEANVYYEEWCLEAEHGCAPYTAFNQTAIGEAVKSLEDLISLEARLVVLNLIWKQECRQWDFCRAESVEEAMRHLDESKVMSLEASKIWLQNVQNGKVPVHQMQSFMKKAVEDMYATRGGSICDSSDTRK